MKLKIINGGAKSRGKSRLAINEKSGNVTRLVIQETYNTKHLYKIADSLTSDNRGKKELISFMDRMLKYGIHLVVTILNKYLMKQ